MSRLIEIDPQVQQEPEPKGYEFDYYTFDNLPNIEVTNIESNFNLITDTIVIATIPTTSKLSTPTDEENRIGYETNLSTENTKDEIHTDTSTWSTADRKKLQHMTEFHQEYQCVFGKGASIQTIMKRRISHMNPPMPKAVSEDEMQSTHLDNSEVIIEYMTNARGNKIKKLKPIFIKSEPDREHTHHTDSNDDLPAVPEGNLPRRER